MIRPALDYPLTDFSNWMRSREFSIATRTAYTSAVRRLLRQLDGDATATQDLEAVLTAAPHASYPVLLSAWRTFRAYALTLGDTTLADPFTTLTRRRQRSARTPIVPLSVRLAMALILDTNRGRTTGITLDTVGLMYWGGVEILETGVVAGHPRRRDRDLQWPGALLVDSFNIVREWALPPGADPTKVPLFPCEPGSPTTFNARALHIMRQQVHLEPRYRDMLVALYNDEIADAILDGVAPLQVAQMIHEIEQEQERHRQLARHDHVPRAAPPPIRRRATNGEPSTHAAESEVASDARVPPRAATGTSPPTPTFDAAAEGRDAAAVADADTEAPVIVPVPCMGCGAADGSTCPCAVEYAEWAQDRGVELE